MGIDLLRSDGRGNHARTGSVLRLDGLWSKDGKNGTGDRHNTWITKTNLENYARLLFSNANGGSRLVSAMVGWSNILDVSPLGTRGIRATGAVAALVYQQHMDPEEAIVLVQGALSDLRQAHASA